MLLFNSADRYLEIRDENSDFLLNLSIDEYLSFVYHLLQDSKIHQQIATSTTAEAVYESLIRLFREVADTKFTQKSIDTHVRYLRVKYPHLVRWRLETEFNRPTRKKKFSLLDSKKHEIFRKIRDRIPLDVLYDLEKTYGG